MSEKERFAYSPKHTFHTQALKDSKLSGTHLLFNQPLSASLPLSPYSLSGRVQGTHLQSKKDLLLAR